MKEFTGKVLAVTGGSSGIGKAIAERFDREGAKVALFGRDQKKLKSVGATLKESLICSGDVCEVSTIDKFYREIKKKWGSIDVLVANAGIAATKPIQEIDEAFFDAIIDTNYKGLFFTIQSALPFINKNASIILISSVAAHIGWPSHSVYSSAKAAVSHLARCLSAELIEKGIRVNAISPGFVDTPLFDPMRKSDPEGIKKRSELIPAKRFALPEEIAHAAYFLASPLSSYICGIDLVIDGGMSAIFQAAQQLEQHRLKSKAPALKKRR